MLKYIKEMLSNSSVEPSNLICCIATDANLREKVKYNPINCTTFVYNVLSVVL